MPDLRYYNGSTWVSLYGAAGADGVNGFGLRFTWSSSTSPTPTSGQLRLNNASPGSATAIYVSETDRNSVGISALLAAITDGSPLLLMDENDDTAYAYYTLTSQTDNGSDRTLTVSHVASGAGAFSDAVTLAFAAKGAEGDPGSTGSVSAASALTLEEQGSITSTGANEIDIANVGGVLQWRLESDGATNIFASTADVALRLPITADTDTIAYGATVDLDMATLTGKYRTISLTGNLTFTTSNRASGRQVVLRLLADASTRTLTFPGGWRFVGTKPANIAASKVGVLSILFFGTADSDCVAAWGVEA